MNDSKINLSNLSFDNQNNELENLLIIKQESFQELEVPEEPIFKDYGDDLNEISISDHLILDQEIKDIEDTFPQYGEDLEEVITMEETNSAFAEYDVKVKVRRLRYFSGPGTDRVDIGIAMKDSVFTIVEEETGPGAEKWGKLKSYEPAWIPLDYCEKIARKRV